MRKRLWLLGGGLLFSVMLAMATETAPATAVATETQVKYPSVEIDLAKKEIRIAAQLSTELLWGEPVLEFILMRGAEKAYETLFLTEADPAMVQLGLVMLGLSPDDNSREKTPAKENTTATTANEKCPPQFMEILLTYHTADGAEKTLPLSDFLISRRTNKTALPMIFAFSGSYHFTCDNGEKVFAASASGVIVAVLTNATAIANLAYYEPSPYGVGDDDYGFALRVADLPPELRTVRIIDHADKDGIVRQVERLIPAPAPVTIILRPLTITRATAERDPYMSEK